MFSEQKEEYVYVLSNPAYPHLYKVGFSHSPEERAKELETTGVPFPFEVRYSHFFEDAKEAEKKVHEKLQQYRVRKNREFFNADLITIVEAIESLPLLGRCAFSDIKKINESQEIKSEYVEASKKVSEQLEKLNILMGEGKEKVKKANVIIRDNNKKVKLERYKRTHSKNDDTIETILAVLALILICFFSMLLNAKDMSNAFSLILLVGFSTSIILTLSPLLVRILSLIINMRLWIGEKYNKNYSKYPHPKQGFLALIIITTSVVLVPHLPFLSHYRENLLFLLEYRDLLVR